MPHQDWDIYHGESAELPVVIKTVKTKQPVPLPGYDLVFMLKDKLDDDDLDALVTKKSAGLTGGSVDQIEIVDDGTVPKRGQAVIYIGASETRALDHTRSYFYAVALVKSADDFFKVVIQGNLEFKESVIKGPVT